MRGVLNFVVFAVLFVGICALGQGAFEVSMDERGGGQGCYDRVAPAGEPQGVEPQTSAWPLGQKCVWTLGNGTKQVDRPDWRATWLVYGGGALTALGCAAAVGLLYRRAFAGEVRRNR